jgi:hypothetical protein
VQTEIPIRRPEKNWFLRSHPDPEFTLPIDILELKDCPDEGTYFLGPDVEFPEELYEQVIPAMITRCITSDRVEFFYLAKQSSKSPKDSTRQCLREAKYNWIKQAWNNTSKSYNYVKATQLRREPVWSNATLDELLEKALATKMYISRPDHEVINRLLFPDDEDYQHADTGARE